MPTFVVRPRVRVRPGDELLVDPREQARRGVRERVPERLGLGGLFHHVAGTRGPERGRPADAILLSPRVGRDERSQVEPWGRAEGERHCAIVCHVVLAWRYTISGGAPYEG